MATVAQIQAVLDPASTGNIANIQNMAKVDATYDEFYVVGVTDPYSGKAGWIRKNNANSAATQGAAILAALKLL